MKFKTRYNLWKLKRSASPSFVFKAVLRKDLRKAWDAAHGSPHWYEFPLIHKAVSMAVVALLLTGAGGAYAYNSPEVTEGTPLYSIKEALENVEEITRITPEAKAKFYLKKIERREAEREVIKERLLPEIQSEIERIEVEIASGTKSEIEVEVQEKTKIKAAERKIRKTEKSIEKAEAQLEKTQKIFEKSKSKNVKLLQEVRSRIERSQQRRRMQAEIKAETKFESNIEEGVVPPEESEVSGTERIELQPATQTEANTQESQQEQRSLKSTFNLN
ncbi:MAG: hypothetical protein HYT15_02115 [Candidatus Magasanikbacteria bacterium]|nr:hypothetical protein [Candidatus Magasanikbacteria bacterium]